jgi:hypothetical protein
MTSTGKQETKLAEQSIGGAGSVGVRRKPRQWWSFVAFLIVALLVVWLLYRGFQTMRFGRVTAVRLPAPVASLALDDTSGAILVSHWKRDYASLFSLASRRVERVPLSEMVKGYDYRDLPPSIAISPKGWGAVVTKEGIDVLDLKKKGVVRHFLGPVNVAWFDSTGDILHADMRTIKMPGAQLVTGMGAGAAEFFSHLAAHDEEAKHYALAIAPPTSEKPWKLVFGNLYPMKTIREAEFKTPLSMQEVAVVPGGRGALVLAYAKRMEVHFVPADPNLRVRTIPIPGGRPWEPTQGMPPPGTLGHRRLDGYGKSEVTLVRDDKHCLLIDLRAGKYISLPFGANALAVSEKRGLALFGKGRAVKLWPIPQRDSKGVLRVPSTNRPIF